MLATADESIDDSLAMLSTADESIDDSLAMHLLLMRALMTH